MNVVMANLTNYQMTKYFMRHLLTLGSRPSASLPPCLKICETHAAT